MLSPLPEPLGRYFLSETTDDTAGMGQFFAHDAVVHDEGRTHSGIAAIQAWKAEGKTKTAYIAEPVATAESEGGLSVTVRVTGHFPNSPVMLDYHFKILGDLITELEIH